MKTNPSERMGLRGYQVEAFNAITKGFGEFQKQLAVKPTGSGKTILFAKLAEKKSIEDFILNVGAGEHEQAQALGCCAGP